GAPPARPAAPGAKGPPPRRGVRGGGLPGGGPGRGGPPGRARGAPRRERRGRSFLHRRDARVPTAASSSPDRAALERGRPVLLLRRSNVVVVASARGRGG